MVHENKDDGLIRRYLLCQLTEDELEQIEEEMMADNEFFDRVLLAEDEMVEECVQGELSESDRARFEASFLSTSEGQQQVALARALRKHVSTAAAEAADAGKMSAARQPVSPLAAWWRQLTFSPSLRLAATLVIVLGLGLGTWRVFFYQSDVSKGIAVLAYAYREQRPVEARISGFNYAPAATTRGDEEKVDRVARNRAERILFDAVSEHPGSASHHALGQLYLAEQKLDDAIREFDEALKGDPSNARIYSDYGAALLEKGKPGSGDPGSRRLEELGGSLEHLSKALELDSEMLDALFNRALCRQYLFLRHQAQEDWRSYLEKDPNSKWADEARQNLNRLEEQKNSTSQNEDGLYRDFLDAYVTRDDEKAWKAFSQSRARTGNAISERLLDGYLAMSATQRRDDRRELAMLRYAGALETHRVNDRFTLELARFYTLASSSRRLELARGRELMKSGYAQFNRSEFDGAIEAFAEAKRFFDRSGDSWEALFADNWMGNCYLRIGDAQRSASIFQRLTALAEGKWFRWLLAQSLNALADAQTNINEVSKALDYAGRSLSVSKQIEDNSLILRNLQVSVSMHLQLNDYRKSLDFSARALPLASIFAEPKQSWPFYYETSLAFYFLDCDQAALQFQKEALRLALESKWPLIISRSYSRLGLIYAKLREYDDAIRNGQLALLEGDKIVGERSRLNITANASLRLGHLYRQAGQASKALESYEQASPLYSKLNLEAYLYETHKGKLLAYITLGNDAAAKEELDVAEKIFDQYRAKIVEETSRDSFFDAEQNVYDLGIAFEYSRLGNARRAFELSEVSRARSSLDLKQPGVQVREAGDVPELMIPSVLPALTLERIQANLPEESQIVQYSILDERLLIWTISKTHFEATDQHISISELTQKIYNYLDMLKNPAGPSVELRSQAKELYGILISPIKPFLNQDHQLCIVPEKALTFLPFAALIAPSNGKYLVEDYKIVMAPSSSLFVSCSDSARRKSTPRDERLLSVGQTYFDKDRFGSLPELRSAGNEARAVAACYHSPSVLVDDDVREERVKTEMQRADVIHFASHYVVDEGSPLLSRLLLSNEARGGSRNQDTDGALQSYEIYRMKLPQTRLVVLAACRTGIERSYLGEGAIGMARSFVSADVPLVVASMWSVDSDSTARLMIGFHNHRTSEHVSTVEALRRAQLDAINGADERYRAPYYWGSFSVIGGYADF